MLDQDDTQNPTTDAAAGETPAAPVVTRRTRKAPAKKAAAAPEPAAQAPAEPAVEAPAQSTAEPTGEPTAEATAEPGAAAPARKTTKRAPAKKAASKRAAAPEGDEAPAPAKKAAARKTAAKAPAKKAAAKKAAPPAVTDEPTEPTEPADATDTAAAAEPAGHAVLFQAPVATTTRRTRKRAAPEPVEPDPTDEDDATDEDEAAEEPAAVEVEAEAEVETEPTRPARKSTRKRSASKKAAAPAPDAADSAGTTDPTDTADQADAASSDDTDARDDSDDSDDSGDDESGTGARRRRRRGGRRRRKGGDGEAGDDATSEQSSDQQSTDEESSDTSGSSDSGDDSGSADAGEGNGEGSSRRRRRRRRTGDDGGDDETPNTVTRVRRTRSAEDQITSVQGSTRLEAKKQRRREGREAGRRRAPIVSEAEFLARREAVERVMVIRQRQDLTQIAVLEDKVLVEHYVARESQTSLIGNVYLGRVQNVLPSMEAAFIDIGKGRNAVLYAGEVNWQALGHKEGAPRKIESVLSSGQMILVQVSKDPIGHKGARLTTQVSLAGRFLVYVPDGTTSGISRKLPDTERNRLKTLLKEIVPDTAGVIVRTAAEGASEEELTRDVERLKARWEDIEKKSAHKGSGPQMLYGEPDLTLKVVRDLFTEDFSKLVIEGDDAWDTVSAYVESMAPDLSERVEKYQRNGAGDIFSTYRIDEQIHKGLDRKVWLPSGGSLVIDRTEAMTVVDVNTGKFTGSGGNLEETVTKNNLEAAEEIVRQLRLRDIGGIIVVDFIDMVLESNRDLVVRRLVECLGRDRTRHQVAEVTSLGLVQMTRKRIGTGLLESFSENCDHCQGRGVVIKDQPVDPDAAPSEGEGRRSGRRRGRRGSDDAGDNGSSNGGSNGGAAHAPSPKDVAAMARHEKAADAEPVDEVGVSRWTSRWTSRTPRQSPEAVPEVEPRKGSDADVEAPAEAGVETPVATEAADETADETVSMLEPSRAGSRRGTRRGREAAGRHAYASALRQPPRRPAVAARVADQRRRRDAAGVGPGRAGDGRRGAGRRRCGGPARGARPDQEEGLAQALAVRARRRFAGPRPDPVVLTLGVRHTDPCAPAPRPYLAEAWRVVRRSQNSAVFTRSRDRGE